MVQLSPLIAFHITTALGAVILGPVVLWSRMGSVQKPRLHRAKGYAYVILMLLATLSASFIRNFDAPNFRGITAIQVMVPFTLGSLWIAFRAISQKDFATHRIAMQSIYAGACLIEGGFSLLPSRYVGNVVWHQWLGWL